VLLDRFNSKRAIRVSARENDPRRELVEVIRERAKEYIDRVTFAVAEYFC